MLRKTLLALGVLALLGLSLQFGRTAEAAPTSVSVAQGCSENGVGVDVTLSWVGASASATQSLADVSLYNNGWLPGTYTSSGAISPNQTSFKFVSLLPNTQYYVRVSQLSGGLWDSSITFMFMTGPACSGASTSYASPSPTYGSTSPSYGMSSGYFGLSSFSQQPIDYWVQLASAAFYFPPRAPIYTNCYPAPFVSGCHFP
jgi:hypothetical protein